MIVWARPCAVGQARYAVNARAFKWRSADGRRFLRAHTLQGTHDPIAPVVLSRTR
jgi:hypothetical protein